jgi:hypothetical protein
MEGQLELYPCLDHGARYCQTGSPLDHSTNHQLSLDVRCHLAQRLVCCLRESPPHPHPIRLLIELPRDDGCPRGPGLGWAGDVPLNVLLQYRFQVSCPASCACPLLLPIPSLLCGLCPPPRASPLLLRDPWPFLSAARMPTAASLAMKVATVSIPDRTYLN